ncbi:MAG: methylated-DNA--[protein]-cysteine S-methyltransferase [Solirubrobacterales bacterium]|nr:methylated-DNA--[protein]-cysteine S-methyltransferase [Thermoplasmata archaeon]
MSPLSFSNVETPIGTFRVVYEGQTVHLIDLLERGVAQSTLPEGARRRAPPFPPGSPPRQVGEYFRNRRDRFEVAVETAKGSEFDRTIWSKLMEVPAGSTVTYGQLARRAGHPGAARAVGGSMHRNPIPIVIPCHRVVGESGDLRGFGLGLWRKRWLLDREGAWPLKSKAPEGPRSAQQRTLDESPGPRRKARTPRKPPEGPTG